MCAVIIVQGIPPGAMNSKRSKRVLTQPLGSTTNFHIYSVFQVFFYFQENTSYDHLGSSPRFGRSLIHFSAIKLMRHSLLKVTPRGYSPAHFIGVNNGQAGIQSNTSYVILCTPTTRLSGGMGTSKARPLKKAQN